MGLVLFLVALIVVLATVQAAVPQVKLCGDISCPSVSRIGLGTLHLGDKIGGLFDPVSTNKWLNSAFNAGINLIDTADVYPVKGGTAGDSAILLGKALKLSPGLRQKLVIVAKTGIVFPSTIDTSAEHIQAQVDWFLASLQTNYLDVLLLHYPNSYMDATVVAQTFAALKASGKVRHFGVSNHYPSHFDLLQSTLTKLNTGISLVTNEVEVSVWNPRYMNYDNTVVDHSYTNGYHILGWGGLAGDPTGGLNRLFQKPGVRQERILKALDTVGGQLGVNDTSVVALAWTLSHPAGIIPLIGTTKTERVDNLVTAFDLVGKFTSEQWWKIGGAGGLCALADNQCNYDGY